MLWYSVLIMLAQKHNTIGFGLFIAMPNTTTYSFFTNVSTLNGYNYGLVQVS